MDGRTRTRRKMVLHSRLACIVIGCGKYPIRELRLTTRNDPDSIACATQPGNIRSTAAVSVTPAMRACGSAMAAQCLQSIARHSVNQDLGSVLQTLLMFEFGDFWQPPRLAFAGLASSVLLSPIEKYYGRDKRLAGFPRDRALFLSQAYPVLSAHSCSKTVCRYPVAFSIIIHLLLCYKRAFIRTAT